MPPYAVFRGKWLIRFKSREAQFDQRFKVEGSSLGDGTYAGTPGTEVLVSGDSWRLLIEHDDGSGWKSSEVRLTPRSVVGVSVSCDVESEDIAAPEGGGDWNDLILTAEYKGPVFQLAGRPFAVRQDNLTMMPDGIFDTSIGVYYIGVQIRSHWVETLGPSTVVDLSEMCRHRLENKGIRIDDQWDSEELAALGQTLFGRGIQLGELHPGEISTVYFKADVSDSPPCKIPLELYLFDRTPVPDPSDPRRFAERRIFVSRSHYDSDTLEMVCEIPEGTVSVSVKGIAAEEGGLRLRCRRLPVTERARSPGRRRLLREGLERLLGGEDIDPCTIKRILDATCCDEARTPIPPYDVIKRDGRVCWVDPCYYFLTAIRARFDAPPYTGTFGPIPFEDPWWKVVFLILAAIFGGAAAADAIDRIADADEHKVAEVSRSLEKPFDASVARLTGERDFFSCQGRTGVLDAQTGDEKNAHVKALDALLLVEPSALSLQEIEAAIDDYVNGGDTKAARVFKSGARTGIAYGLMTSTSPITLNKDGKTISGNLVGIVAEVDGEDVSQKGDSGSVWIRVDDSRPVALHHSVPCLNWEDGECKGADRTRTNASILIDVLEELNVTLVPKTDGTP